VGTNGNEKLTGFDYNLPLSVLVYVELGTLVAVCGLQETSLICLKVTVHQLRNFVQPQTMVAESAYCRWIITDTLDKKFKR